MRFCFAIVAVFFVIQSSSAQSPPQQVFAKSGSEGIMMRVLVSKCVMATKEETRMVNVTKYVTKESMVDGKKVVQRLPETITEPQKYQVTVCKPVYEWIQQILTEDACQFYRADGKSVSWQEANQQLRDWTLIARTADAQPMPDTLRRCSGRNHCNAAPRPLCLQQILGPVC